MELIGTPSKEVLERIDNQSARSYVEQQPKRPAQDFKGKFPNLNADGVDLLQKLL